MSKRYPKRLKSTGIGIALTFVILFLALGITWNISAHAQPSNVADAFSFPLGFRDGLRYGPRITYSGPTLLETTDYDVQNPDLKQAYSCFGPPMRELYHAGEDWYRLDGKDTAGAIVTAVANGQVKHVSNPDIILYPGIAVIIEHTLAQPINGYNTVYSVYMHLERGTVSVTAGQQVGRGQEIGRVMHQDYAGNTPGLHNDDSHLHWELRYFEDGSNIYPSYTTCNDNRVVAGRGYTYPEHPDDFPPGTPYTDPSAFIGYKSYLPIIFKNPTPVPTPTPRPTITPTPVPSCIEGQNLIVNGGLENTGQHYLWIEDDGDPSGYWPLIDDVWPHQGTYSIWMGGRNDANEEIYQRISIPHGTTSATLTFWLYVTTQETSTQDEYDKLYWDLRGDTTGESLLVAPLVYTNLHEDKDEWNREICTVNRLYLLAGRTIRFSFSDTTDHSNITSFWIDDITFNIHCNE